MRQSFLNKVIVLVLSVIMIVTFTACSKDDTMKKIKKDKVVVMGTNAEFPPFEYVNDNGEVDGFDVAMSKEIAKELGVELKIENMAFDSLLNALKSGKIDFVAAGMTVKPDRLENADFSDTYFNATQLIIVQKDNDTILGKADLVGKKIGVQEGTTGDFEASDIEGAEVSRFKKGLDAIMDLNNGKLDAVIIDSNPAKVFVQKNADTIKLLDEQLTEEDYAIAVRKGDAQLLEAINKSISDMKENGKYDDIIAEYIKE